MNKSRYSLMFRTIALAMVIAFIAMDVAYARGDDYNFGHAALSTPSRLQQDPPDNSASLFQSEGALIASVYDIGKYFIEDSGNGKGRLPWKLAEDFINIRLGNLLQESGIEILNIVPVDFIEKYSPNELKDALSQIGYTGNPPSGVVGLILYKKGGERFLVQIVERGRVSNAAIPGYEVDPSGKYEVKIVPESKGWPATRSVKSRASKPSRRTVEAGQVTRDAEVPQQDAVRGSRASAETAAQVLQALRENYGIKTTGLVNRLVERVGRERVSLVTMHNFLVKVFGPRIEEVLVLVQDETIGEALKRNGYNLTDTTVEIEKAAGPGQITRQAIRRVYNKLDPRRAIFYSSLVSAALTVILTLMISTALGAQIHFAVYTAMVLFSAVIGIGLHEAGHYYIAAYLGLNPEGIFDIASGEIAVEVTTEDGSDIEGWKNIIIALAGPVVNFLACYYFLNFIMPVSLETSLAVGLVNLFLGLFSLLPLGNSDGAMIREAIRSNSEGKSMYRYCIGMGDMRGGNVGDNKAARPQSPDQPIQVDTAPGLSAHERLLVEYGVLNIQEISRMRQLEEKFSQGEQLTVSEIADLEEYFILTWRDYDRQDAVSRKLSYKKTSIKSCIAWPVTSDGYATFTNVRILGDGRIGGTSWRGEEGSPSYMTGEKVLMIRSELNITDGMVILDYGCGDADVLIKLAQEFPGADFIGLDASAYNIRSAVKRATELGLNNITFLKNDGRPGAEGIALRDGQVDAVLLFDDVFAGQSPMWINDSLEGITRVLKKDGGKILFFGNYGIRQLKELGKKSDLTVTVSSDGKLHRPGWFGPDWEESIKADWEEFIKANPERAGYKYEKYLKKQRVALWLKYRSYTINRKSAPDIAHRFPLYIWEGIGDTKGLKVRLEELSKEPGISHKLKDACDRVLRGHGMARFNEIKGLLIEDELLPIVAEALNDILERGPFNKLIPSDVKRYLEYHEGLHKKLKRSPGIVKDLLKELQSLQNYEKIKEDFLRSYGGEDGKDANFAEELLVVYMTETMLLNQLPRLLPDGACELKGGRVSILEYDGLFEKLSPVAEKINGLKVAVLSSDDAKLALSEFIVRSETEVIQDTLIIPLNLAAPFGSVRFEFDVFQGDMKKRIRGSLPTGVSGAGEVASIRVRFDSDLGYPVFTAYRKDGKSSSSRVRRDWYRSLLALPLETINPHIIWVKDQLLSDEPGRMVNAQPKKTPGLVTNGDGTLRVKLGKNSRGEAIEATLPSGKNEYVRIASIEPKYDTLLGACVFILNREDGGRSASILNEGWTMASGKSPFRSINIDTEWMRRQLRSKDPNDRKLFGEKVVVRTPGLKADAVGELNFSIRGQLEDKRYAVMGLGEPYGEVTYIERNYSDRLKCIIFTVRMKSGREIVFRIKKGWTMASKETPFGPGINPDIVWLEDHIRSDNATVPRAFGPMLIEHPKGLTFHYGTISVFSYIPAGNGPEKTMGLATGGSDDGPIESIERLFDAGSGCYLIMVKREDGKTGISKIVNTGNRYKKDGNIIYGLEAFIGEEKENLLRRLGLNVVSEAGEAAASEDDGLIKEISGILEEEGGNGIGIEELAVMLEIEGHIISAERLEQILQGCVENGMISASSETQGSEALYRFVPQAEEELPSLIINGNKADPALLARYRTAVYKALSRTRWLRSYTEIVDGLEQEGFNKQIYINHALPDGIDEEGRLFGVIGEGDYKQYYGMVSSLIVDILRGRELNDEGPLNLDGLLKALKDFDLVARILLEEHGVKITKYRCRFGGITINIEKISDVLAELMRDGAVIYDRSAKIYRLKAVRPPRSVRYGFDRKDKAISASSHHFPLYIWKPIMERLEELKRSEGTDEETVRKREAAVRVLSGQGLSRLTDDGMIVIETDILPEVTEVLNRALGRRPLADRDPKNDHIKFDMGVYEVEAYLRYHEEMHLKLRDNPDIVRHVMAELNKLSPDDFNRIIDGFRKNYGLKDTDIRKFTPEELIEELLVVFMTETKELGQLPRILPPDAAHPKTGRISLSKYRDVVDVLNGACEGINDLKVLVLTADAARGHLRRLIGQLPDEKFRDTLIIPEGLSSRCGVVGFGFSHDKKSKRETYANLTAGAHSDSEVQSIGIRFDKTLGYPVFSVLLEDGTSASSRIKAGWNPGLKINPFEKIYNIHTTWIMDHMLSEDQFNRDKYKDHTVNTPGLVTAANGRVITCLETDGEGKKVKADLTCGTSGHVRIRAIERRYVDELKAYVYILHREDGGMGVNMLKRDWNINSGEWPFISIDLNTEWIRYQLESADPNNRAVFPDTIVMTPGLRANISRKLRIAITDAENRYASFFVQEAHGEILSIRRIYSEVLECITYRLNMKSGKKPYFRIRKGWTKESSENPIESITPDVVWLEDQLLSDDPLAPDEFKPLRITGPRDLIINGGAIAIRRIRDNCGKDREVKLSTGATSVSPIRYIERLEHPDYGYLFIVMREDGNIGISTIVKTGMTYGKDRPLYNFKALKEREKQKIAKYIRHREAFNTYMAGMHLPKPSFPAISFQHDTGQGEGPAVDEGFMERPLKALAQESAPSTTYRSIDIERAINLFLAKDGHGPEDYDALARLFFLELKKANKLLQGERVEEGLGVCAYMMEQGDKVKDMAPPSQPDLHDWLNAARMNIDNWTRRDPDEPIMYEIMEVLRKDREDNGKESKGLSMEEIGSRLGKKAGPIKPYHLKEVILKLKDKKAIEGRQVKWRTKTKYRIIENNGFRPAAAPDVQEDTNGRSLEDYRQKVREIILRKGGMASYTEIVNGLNGNEYSALSKQSDAIPAGIDVTGRVYRVNTVEGDTYQYGTVSSLIVEMLGRSGKKCLSEEGLITALQNPAVVKEICLEKHNININTNGMRGGWMKIDWKKAPEVLAEMTEKGEILLSEGLYRLPASTSRLFRLIEDAAHYGCKRFIEDANMVIDDINRAHPEGTEDIPRISWRMTASEARERVESVIRGLDREWISQDIKDRARSIESGLDRFEADSGIVALAALAADTSLSDTAGTARQATGSGNKFVIALETDCISAGTLQQNAITCVTDAIRDLAAKMRSVGVNNVEVRLGSPTELADSLQKDIESGKIAARNVLVLASKDTIFSEYFKYFRDKEPGNKPFLAGIDSSDLIGAYENTDKNKPLSEQLYIALAPSLYMAIEAAMGKTPPDYDWIKYDQTARILILKLPPSTRKDTESLPDKYKAEAKALFDA